MMNMTVVWEQELLAKARQGSLSGPGSGNS